MKKVLFLLMLLIFPLIVFADGAGPYVREYEVYVKNPNGAVLYDYDGKKTGIVASVDQTFDVYMEEIIDGEYYATVYYNERDYLIKASDLALKEEYLKPDEDEKMETPIKYYTYAKGGYLYKGPSKQYDKVNNEMIPIGTILTSYYDSYGWAYVKYGNNEGWIFTYSKNDRNNPYPDDTSFAKFTDETLITLPGSKLMDNEGNVITTIKDFTKVKINYYTGYIGSYGGYGKYNIVYKDNEGWVDISAQEAERDNTVYINKNVKLIDYEGNTIATIPKGTELEYSYYFYNYEGYPEYYVTYHNKNGFISDVDNIHEAWFSEGTKFTANASFELYDKPEGSIIDTKSSKEVFNVKYYISEYDENEEYVGGWVNVIGSNYKGWIRVDDALFIQSYEDGQASDLDSDYWQTPGYDDDYWDEVYMVPDPSSDSSLLDDENTVTHTGLDPEQLSLYCIGGAVILSITSFVTIKLINKKKKNNNDKTPINNRDGENNGMDLK